MEVSSDTVRATVLALLADREGTATVCPSEVARAAATLAGSAADWRRIMPIVHTVIDQLLDEQIVRLSWKGQSLPTRSGPYRIGRAEHG